MEFINISNVQIKDELEEPEINQPTNESHLAETDPMDLLELIEEHEVSFDEGDTCSNSRRSAEVSSDRWQQWMLEFSWLLKEDDDDNKGFCVYCGLTIIVRCKAHISGHASAGLHREREQNYLAFKASEEEASKQSSPDAIAIKHEFGTNSSISALKFKRISQSEAFLNFNWRRWLDAHEWLSRIFREGTMGFCKYCKIKMNVEFTAQRERHEQKPSHLKMAKRYSQQSQHQDASEASSHSSEKADSEEAEESTSASGQDYAPPTKASRARSQILRGPWYEPIGLKACRCRLCHIKMSRTSFGKHLKSQQHSANLRAYKKLKTTPGNSSKELPKPVFLWKFYVKKHPWISVDPEDSGFAYCKYCEKRLMYGTSAVKRSMHENSAGHRSAMHAKNIGATDTGKGDEENGDTEATAEQSEVDEQEEEEENNNEEESNKEAGESEEEEDSDDNSSDSKENDADSDTENAAGTDHERSTLNRSQRTMRGSTQWYEKYSFLQKDENNPDYVYCTYCDEMLALNLLKCDKHVKLQRHRIGEQSYLEKQASAPKDQTAKRNPKTSIHYRNLKVLAKGIPSSLYCKYCHLRFATVTNRRKHERTSASHKEAVNMHVAKLKKKSQTTTPPPVVRTYAPAVAAGKKALVPKSMQGKVILWKNKFPWLSYKRAEMRTNYGYCKYCEQSVFTPTAKYASKHQRSGKHIRQRVLIKRQQNGEAEQPQTQTEQQEQEPEQEPTAASTQEQPVTPSVATDEYSWALPDKAGSADYSYCKYCDARVITRGAFKRAHNNTAKHRVAEQLYIQRNAVKRVKSAESDEEGEVEAITADDVEAVLSVKSECERSMRRQLALRAEDEPAAKRACSDDVIQRISKNLTSAQAGLSRLTRKLDHDPHSPDSMHTPPVMPPQPMPISMPVPVLQPNRNSFDLFFDSMSETMKNLPADLAAEGKLKMMQIVYDLEMRALRRKEQPPAEAPCLGIRIATPPPLPESRELPTEVPLSPEEQPTADTTPPTNGIIPNGHHNVEPNDGQATLPPPPPVGPLPRIQRVESIDTVGSPSIRPKLQTQDVASSVIRRIQQNPALQITNRNDTIRCVSLKALRAPASMSAPSPGMTTTPKVVHMQYHRQPSNTDATNTKHVSVQVNAHGAIKLQSQIRTKLLNALAKSSNTPTSNV